MNPSSPPPAVYLYRKCSTCRAALEWLEKHRVAYQEKPIRDHPPSAAELRAALPHVGGLKRLFNTSGLEYRTLGLKDRLPTMTDDQALRLLAANGMLVKRPLVIGRDFALAGFRPEAWARAFGLR